MGKEKGERLRPHGASPKRKETHLTKKTRHWGAEPFGEEKGVILIDGFRKGD